jgi:GAF domain-containing protein
MASLALESALQGAGAIRGIVLLPDKIGEPPVAAAQSAAGLASELGQAVVVPADWSSAAVPPEVINAVLGTDEALLACATPPSGGRIATISAPIRQGGRPVGVLHVEVDAGQREATPDDLEFVMAVCDSLGLAIDNLAARETLSSRLARSADENEQLRRRLGEEWRMIG